MLALRRTYLVALTIAGLLAVGYVVVPKVAHTIHAQDAHDALVAADAAFNHLKVPADFVALKSGCQWYPCYYVPRTTFQVQPQLPAILKSMGAKADATLAAQCPTPPGVLHAVLCGFAGLSHGYQVIVFLGAYLAICGRHCTPKTRFQSLVQITAPYIPADSEPWNGGSGWPLK